MRRTFERCPGCGAVTWEGETPAHRHRPPCPDEGVSDFESPTFTPLDVPSTPSPLTKSRSVTPLPQDNPTRKESA